MIFKPGTVIDGTRPEMLRSWAVVDEVYLQLTGKEATLTSGKDGEHKPKSGRPSLHYDGLADDFRTRDISENIVPLIVNQIRMRLKEIDSAYDVILEKTHLHIEYDLKG
jgi:hypothetical protein